MGAAIAADALGVGVAIGADTIGAIAGTDVAGVVIGADAIGVGAIDGVDAAIAADALGAATGVGVNSTKFGGGRAHAVSASAASAHASRRRRNIPFIADVPQPMPLDAVCARPLSRICALSPALPRMPRFGKRHNQRVKRRLFVRRPRLDGQIGFQQSAVHPN